MDDTACARRKPRSPRPVWAMAFFFFFIIIIIASSSCHGIPSVRAQRQQCREAEQEMLLRLKREAKGAQLNWSSAADCCTWEGVECTQGHVSGLSLHNRSLEGRIPSVWGGLQSLQTLNLSSNRFRGSLPDDFAALLSLRSLDLSSNFLSGSLAVLAAMESLETLDFSRNGFSGSFPALLFERLWRIERLLGSQNALEGEFPGGSICRGGNASMLRIVDLSSNRFSGALAPGGLGSCANLEEIHMGCNELSGSIPADVFEIAPLSVLCLENNSLSGNLPGSLPKASKMRKLLLASNALGGSIERLDFSRLVSLEVLDLHSNRFSGAIPGSLRSCRGLAVLSLSKNGFAGGIPDLEPLRNLSAISLSSNELSGSFESVMGCEAAASVVLTKNRFSGPLPARPPGGLREVQILALGYLNLSGTIPAWLQNCTKLQVLDLSWNHLEGEIPPWLGRFPHLVYLELSNNSLSGRIPGQLFAGLLAMMRRGSDGGDLRSPGTPPLDVKRQINSAGLIYSGAMAMPASIYLSSNRLSGSIPGAQIGRLEALIHLDLAHNLLEGRVPEELAGLASIESLDLSHNRLSGSLPGELAKLNFLGTFDVSYNRLSGRIPAGAQFGSFPNSSFAGNPGLCGLPVLRPCQELSPSPVPPPPRIGSGRGSVAIPVLASVGLTMGAVLLCLAAGGAALLRRSPFRAERIGSAAKAEKSDGEGGSVDELFLFCFFHGSEEDEEEEEEGGKKKKKKVLCIADIYAATNNFDAANIVGCGGFGLVYRAELGDGSRLAVKKLIGGGGGGGGASGQMEREFRAEVEALSRAKHDNLVPLQGYARIGRDEKLLIYSYMENGSLDYWLHERSDGRQRLEWRLRLAIAKGAAAGLAHLHEACVPHIVHRDIKSSNILLDARFSARLADFGLARLVAPAETHVSTELVGTLGYIPPEYGIGGAGSAAATRRGDVYSFGVVLLELLTGRRPVDICRPRASRDLVTWVLSAHHHHHQHQHQHQDHPRRLLDQLDHQHQHQDHPRQLLDQLDHHQHQHQDHPRQLLDQLDHHQHQHQHHPRQLLDQLDHHQHQHQHQHHPRQLLDQLDHHHHQHHRLQLDDHLDLDLLDHVFDAHLPPPRPLAQMSKLLDVAVLCVDRNPARRPPIGHVVALLDRIGGEDDD